MVLMHVLLSFIPRRGKLGGAMRSALPRIYSLTP
jgi:hypothetical protein